MSQLRLNDTEVISYEKNVMTSGSTELELEKDGQKYIMFILTRESKCQATTFVIKIKPQELAQ